MVRRPTIGLAFLGAVAMVATSTAPAYASGPCGGGVAAPIGVWQEQTAFCGIAGYPGAVVYYGLTLQPGANANITAEVLGYDEHNVATWYGMGTSSVGLQRNVPWGNNLAPPKIRILNNGPALAPPVDWTSSGY
jgi:hypothetical protein